MGDKINDGGSAFPAYGGRILAKPDGSLEPLTEPGMSLRDYFAGQALVGLLSKDISMEHYQWYYNTANRQELAKDAYDIADAMIELRRKSQPQSTKAGDDSE
jgi:hypothetical protein